jgi:hypothetical protein
MTKFNKSEKAKNAPLLALLTYAAEHPTQWHNLGPDPECTEAAKLLATHGILELRLPQKQFRLVNRPSD